MPSRSPPKNCSGVRGSKPSKTTSSSHVRRHRPRPASAARRRPPSGRTGPGRPGRRPRRAPSPARRVCELSRKSKASGGSWSTTPTALSQRWLVAGGVEQEPVVGDRVVHRQRALPPDRVLVARGRGAGVVRRLGVVRRAHPDPRRRGRRRRCAAGRVTGRAGCGRLVGDVRAGSRRGAARAAGVIGVLRPWGSRNDRAGAPLRGLVAGVGQGAGLEAQAAAADAAVEPVAQPLDPLDLLVEARPPGLAQPVPVGLGRRPAVGEGGEGRADLLQAEPDPLRGADERDPAQRRLLVAALVARRTHRGDQAPATRRTGSPTSPPPPARRGGRSSGASWLQPCGTSSILQVRGRRLWSTTRQDY